MNQDIRKLLIDQAVKGIPIAYGIIGEKLNLDLSSISDRNSLSKTLGEISAFEHENGRPLISSMAIYKDNSTNDYHGIGFYNVCEELGIGKAKNLQERFYAFTQMEMCKDFWQDKRNYENFYHIATPIDDDPDAPPFFNQTEIDFFKKWCDKAYDPKNSDHVHAKNYLIDTVWEKTKFWANQAVARLSDYEASTKKYWSKRGWDDGKSVSKFKPYTWARIYKRGDKAKDIFFTLGVAPKENRLFIDIDYFRESSTHLSAEQLALCKKYISDDTREIGIPVHDLEKLNWEKLVHEAIEFISKNSHHYDQIIDLVWGKKEIIEVFGNSLSLTKFPKDGLSALPPRTPSFKGRQVDFIEKNKENKELGDAGEELVRDYEIKKLIEKNMPHLAKRVRIAEDGEGYDIQSFDEHGNEKFIEVKTTTGNIKAPFHMSLNEYLFCEKNKEQYCIYRLYDYDFQENHAKFFIVDDPLNTLLFDPIAYQVYIKKV